MRFCDICAHTADNPLVRQILHDLHSTKHMQLMALDVVTPLAPCNRPTFVVMQANGSTTHPFSHLSIQRRWASTHRSPAICTSRCPQADSTHRYKGDCWLKQDCGLKGYQHNTCDPGFWFSHCIALTDLQICLQLVQQLLLSQPGFFFSSDRLRCAFEACLHRCNFC